MMYLVDRLKPSPEDRASGGTSAGSFVHARLRTFAALLAATLATLIVCCVLRPSLLIAIAISLAISLPYVLPIPGLGRRVKELPGCKPLYLGLLTTTITSSFAWLDGGRPTPIGVFAVAATMLVNAALCDLKDVDADRRAGLRSLASVLGRWFFVVLHAINLATAVLVWLVAEPEVAFLVTLLATYYALVVWVARRRPFDTRMAAAIDTGTAVLLIVGWIALA
jgi:4-hydroxybenzoate polyprenyltransferase